MGEHRHRQQDNVTPVERFLEAWTRLATTASEGQRERSQSSEVSMSAAGPRSLTFDFGLRRAGATELTLRGNQSDWPMGSQACGPCWESFTSQVSSVSLCRLRSRQRSSLSLRLRRRPRPVEIGSLEKRKPAQYRALQVRQIASKPVYDVGTLWVQAAASAARSRDLFRSLPEAVSDTTTFSLDTNLTFRHFAGVVDSTILGHRSAYVFEERASSK